MVRTAVLRGVSALQLQVVAGRAGAGKSRWIYKRIGEALEKGRQPILLVPEQFTLQAERQLLDTLGLPGILDAQVISPTKLRADVYTQNGTHAPEVLDERGCAMALFRVAAEQRESLRLFANTAQKPGFVAALSGLLADFGRFDVTPDKLRQAGQGHVSGILRDKLSDLALLMESYGSFLAERSLQDSSVGEDTLIGQIAASGYPFGRPVFVDGFDYLPPKTIRLLGALMAGAGEMALAVSLSRQEDADADIFAAGAYNLRSLKEMAQRQGARFSVEWLSRPQAPDPVLAHLERHLFVYPAQAYQGAESTAVTSYCASTPEEEAEAAASYLCGLLRHGSRYRDIAVVCGQLENYAPSIQRVFARYNIPIFLDTRRSVAQHPLVGYLFSLLRLIAHNGQADGWLQLIKTGYAGVEPAQAEDLEVYIRTHRIRGLKAFDTPWIKPLEGFDLDDLNAWRERVAGPIRVLGKDGQRSAEEWAHRLYAALETAGIPERLEEQRRREAMDGQADAALETAQIWNQVVGALDQMVLLLGEMPLDVQEALGVLESGFASAEIGILPTGVDQVVVGDVGRTKTATVKHLLVVGMADGVFPGRYPEGTLLHEGELAVLMDGGLPIGRDAGMRSAQSRYEAYHTLSKPTQSLWLSYAAGDGVGGTAQPSYLYLRVRRFLPVAAYHPPVWPSATPAALLRPAGQALRTLREGGTPPGNWKAALSTLCHHPATQTILSRMLSVGLLSGDIPEGLLPETRTISASRLETYARCPFQWFAAYALAPEPWPEEGADLAQGGVFLHAAMALLGEELMKMDAIDGEKAVEAMARISERLLQEQAGIFDATAQTQWYGEKLRTVAARGAEAMAGQLSLGAFRPQGFEVRFGPGEAFEPIPVAVLGGEEALLLGQVDRVDVFRAPEGDYLRVIDYKSGGSPPDLAGAMEGWQQQLWLYLRALCENWERYTGRPARPAGVFYAPLRDDWADIEKEPDPKPGRLQGWCLNTPQILEAMDSGLAQGKVSAVAEISLSSRGMKGTCYPERMEAIQRGVKAACEGLVGDMRKGQVAPSPMASGQHTLCGTCRHRNLCGRGMLRYAPERKPAGAAAVKAWLATHGDRAEPAKDKDG